MVLHGLALILPWLQNLNHFDLLPPCSRMWVLWSCMVLHDGLA
jgi:hypothetical protein